MAEINHNGQLDNLTGMIFFFFLLTKPSRISWGPSVFMAIKPRKLNAAKIPELKLNMQ